MSEATDPQAWVARAEEDYLLARSALRRKTPLTYGACFHAQQCAEKYLKAVLVQHGRAFPKTHDLQTLHDICVQVGIYLGLDLDELDTLSSYAVRVRYPGDDPVAEEARHAVAIAKSVRRVARRFMGI